MAIIKNFVVLKKIDYTYMASSQNRFVLSDLLITVNLSKYEKKHYISCIRMKKHFIVAFVKINSSWILVFPSTLLYLSLILLV